MLTRIKRQDTGFTLIEVLVVVVIVAILAAISVPIYIQYVQGARASDAQATIGAIYNSVKMFRQDFGEDPSSVEELQELEYLEIDEGTLCLLYTSPSPRDQRGSRMPSSA